MPIQFVHPGLALATAGLMMLPLLIHLLSRRRYRDEHWAAMAFLRAAHQRSRRRMMIEHWLLLLLRTLVIAALGFGVSRPQLADSPIARAAGRQLWVRVLILDDSLSMQARREDGRTAFAAARELARDMLEQFDAADEVALLTMSGGGRALVRRPTVDRALITDLLESLNCTYDRADLSGAIQLAAEVVSEAGPRTGNHAVYILTDLARSSWLPVGDAVSADPAKATASSGDQHVPAHLGEWIDRIGDAGARFVVDTGAKQRGNAAVSRMALPSPFADPDAPLELTVEVQTFDRELAPNAELHIVLDGQTIRRLPIAGMGNLATNPVTVTLRSPRVGTHVLKARLSARPDLLPSDDERTLVFTVRHDLPVLIVSDGMAAEPDDNPAFYIDLALAPQRYVPEAVGRHALFAPETVSSAELAAHVPSDYRAIILAGAPSLSIRQWRRIADYVRRGGGLLISMGASADLKHYVHTIGPAAANDDLRGLLPVALERVIPVDDAARPARLKPAAWTHPVLAELHGHVGGG
ncbi:MAG: BatA domain-containing protein, partial [Phycisphaerae bacterium]